MGHIELAESILHRRERGSSSSSSPSSRNLDDDSIPPSNAQVNEQVKVEKGGLKWPRTWLDKLHWRGTRVGTGLKEDEEGGKKKEDEEKTKKENAAETQVKNRFSWIKIGRFWCKENCGDEGLPLLPLSTKVSESSLMKRIKQKDWKGVIEACKRDTRNLKIEMLEEGNCAIHMAVIAGDLAILKEMLKVTGPVGYDMVNGEGNTILHLAAMKDDIHICQHIVEEHKHNMWKKNSNGETALFLSAKYGSSKSFQVLFGCFLNLERDYNFCLTKKGDTIMHVTIREGLIDMACTILDNVPALVLFPNDDGETPLHCLANLPRTFRSRNEYGCLQRCRYSCIPMCIVQNLQARCCLCPSILERKRNHMKSNYLVKKMMDFLVEKDLEHGLNFLVLHGPVICAINNGVAEVVKAILAAFPHIIDVKDRESETLLFLAAKGRKSQVFSIVLESVLDKNKLRKVNKKKDSVLHVAAAFHEYKCWSGLGAPVQMMLEERWFTSVKDAVPSRLKYLKNAEGLTPDELFDKSHADLLKRSQDWIKSFTNVISILASVFTVFALGTFATIPGGTDNDGLPRKKHTWSYEIYNYGCTIAGVFGFIAFLSFVGLKSLNMTSKRAYLRILWGLLIGMTSTYFCSGSVLVAVLYGKGVAQGQDIMHITYFCIAGIISCTGYLLFWQWKPYKTILKGICWSL